MRIGYTPTYSCLYFVYVCACIICSYVYLYLGGPLNSILYLHRPRIRAAKASFDHVEQWLGQVQQHHEPLVGVGPSKGDPKIPDFFRKTELLAVKNVGNRGWGDCGMARMKTWR